MAGLAVATAADLAAVMRWRRPPEAIAAAGQFVAPLQVMQTGATAMGTGDQRTAIVVGTATVTVIGMGIATVIGMDMATVIGMDTATDAMAGIMAVTTGLTMAAIGVV